MEDLYWLLFSCSGVSVSSKRISYNTNNSLSVPNRRPEHIYPAHAISGSRQLAPAPRLIGSNNPGKKSTGHLATQPATRKYISVVQKYLTQLSVSSVQSARTNLLLRFSYFVTVEKNNNSFPNVKMTHKHTRASSTQQLCFMYFMRINPPLGWRKQYYCIAMAGLGWATQSSSLLFKFVENLNTPENPLTTPQPQLGSQLGRINIFIFGPEERITIPSQHRQPQRKYRNILK